MQRKAIGPNAKPGKYKRLLMLLSPREKQILEMICDGMSNEEIATILDIQALTVKFHLKTIYAALGTNKRHAAIIEAVKAGVVRPSWINAR
jgi:DNA-binding CsgD family transcriptional regulator